MIISIITPILPNSFTGKVDKGNLITGNIVTAKRWEKLLKKLGHQVTVKDRYDAALNNTQNTPDVLVVINAFKRYQSAVSFKTQNPQKKLIVLLAGTDLYGEDEMHDKTKSVLSIADTILVLQPLALKKLSDKIFDKAICIYQSVEKQKGKLDIKDKLSKITNKDKKFFQFCLIAHLRKVKDPLRAVKALELIDDSQNIKIKHIGTALDAKYGIKAQQSMYNNKHYSWIGGQSQSKTASILASSDALILSSLSEGGANVIGEALVNNIPVICSKIEGNVGLLGREYLGYFKPKNTKQLASLMLKIKNNPKFANKLKKQCAKKKSQFKPSKELATWKKILKNQ